MKFHKTMFRAKGALGNNMNKGDNELQDFFYSNRRSFDLVYNPYRSVGFMAIPLWSVVSFFNIENQTNCIRHIVS